MTDVKYKGKTLSFWELSKRHGIEIPIIQRDYAQGRAEKHEVREKFLKALYNSLNESKAIKLDFIYGSMENDVFQPLDGQQRLTTLFLLHWYAAIKDQSLNDESIKILKKFSYETRISSRDFCDILASQSFVLNKKIRLSSQIVDSSWFFLSWKRDPTIDAMLRMIDDIHKYFFELDNLWNKLTSENSMISFYHVELENIGLTDDLYIKMNARGKLLSPFENFKASFQKCINDNKWDHKKEVTEKFSVKIDTAWADLFWVYKKNNNVDEAFIRFISSILMIRISIRKDENRFSIISRLQEDYNSIKPEFFNENDFNYLVEVFNIYYGLFKDELELTIPFPLFQHRTRDGIFSSIIYEGFNASYSQKVLFFAQTEYLRKVQDFKLSKYQDWMRVIRNIVSRGDVAKNGKRPTIIRSPQTFDGVINLIAELSAGCEDIYEYLSNVKHVKSSFAKEQMEEEKLKSKIIISNNIYRQTIFDLEDTNLLQGRIEFALYCIDYKSKEYFDSSFLDKVVSILNKYFSKDADITNKVRRALLTISNNEGDYNYYGYWWSFWNVVSANKRCLIRNNLRELEFYIYGNSSNDYRIYLKNLILKLIDNTLDEIIEGFIPPEEMPNWKIRLIKESELLDNKCKSNYIAIPEDDSCCYLLKSMRPRDLNGCEKIK